MSKSATRPRVTFLEVIAELVITAGVLLLLYVAWLLWFNDAISAGAQREAAVQVTTVWDEEPPPPAPAEPGEIPILDDPDYDTTFAVLKVPRWGTDYKVPIIASNTTDTLKRGIAHYDKTQMPGEVGNFAIAGHRTTYGSPFAGIAELRLGDALVVETKLGWYIYRWRNTEYVWPTGTGVLAPVPQNGTKNPRGDRVITLTSCHPRFSAAERIIGYGVFDRFQPRSAGAPAELNGGTA